MSEVITNQKNTELALQESEKRRFEAQKLESLGILAAGVAHNMNNVLAIILGTASMHEENTAEPVFQEAFRTIGRACIRGRDLVKSLLRFSQPNLSNNLPLELHTLIKELCTLMESTTRNRVHVSMDFAEEPIWIKGDAGDISHALMNLCINSLDAMPDGGLLTLRTRLIEKNGAEIIVEDSGTGMTAEVLAHVLEPFYTTKEVGKGTGLGLSMTYGVVKAHGGTLDITSQPGQGTIVKLRFPRIQASTNDGKVQKALPSLETMNVFRVKDSRAG